MLKFSVTFKPGIPIYKQVVYAVTKAIVSGQLKPGDKFSSVRELSRELKINPNTVQKVINHLVQAKLLEISPGIGSVVAEAGKATREQREQILQIDIERLVVESKKLSIEKKEIMDAINRQWGEGK
jgi:GntR family transcriptional regulator